MLYETQNPHGGDVYGAEIALDYSSNVNPLGTPPGVVRAICEAAQLVRQYPDPYCRALREAIAAHEQVDMRWVLCGNGAAELIYAWCEALRPKLAAELAPTFCEYSIAAGHYGARMARYALLANNGFCPDEGLLRFLKETKPDALFLCTPNNPTGRTIDRALLERTLELCEQQRTRVLLDESFLDFTDAKSAKDLLARYPGLLILKAFTKSYALAGARVGYCLSADTALLSRMAHAAQPWNVSLLAQRAGIAALQEQDFLRRAKALVARERAFLAQGLQTLRLRVFLSEANYLLFCGPAGLDAALRREKIAIRSCENYDGLGPGYYRIAVRLHEENEKLLAAMRRAMEVR